MLFDHYHGPVYRYVAARVGRPSDAEDLAQLVFVKALEALPRYESRGVPFGGWLFRLARNVVIDHVRTRRDHTTARPRGPNGPPRTSGPDELAALRQELDSVAAALRRLTPEQREAIELRFFAGLSAREAAVAMGRQEGTVRGLQFRAIAALRRELGIEPGADELPGPGLGDRTGERGSRCRHWNRARARSSSARSHATRRVRLDPSPAAVAACPRGRDGGGLAPALRLRGRGRRQDRGADARGAAVRPWGARRDRRVAGGSRAGRGSAGRILGVRGVPGRRAAVRHAARDRGADAAERPDGPPRGGDRAGPGPDRGDRRGGVARAIDGAVDAAVRAYGRTLDDLDEASRRAGGPGTSRPSRLHQAVLRDAARQRADAGATRASSARSANSTRRHRRTSTPRTGLAAASPAAAPTGTAVTPGTPTANANGGGSGGGNGNSNPNGNGSGGAGAGGNGNGNPNAGRERQLEAGGNRRPAARSNGAGSGKRQRHGSKPDRTPQPARTPRGPPTPRALGCTGGRRRPPRIRGPRRSARGYPRAMTGRA